MFLANISEKIDEKYAGDFGAQRMMTWSEGQSLEVVHSEGPIFGFVSSGKCHVLNSDFDIKIKSGQYFCLNGKVTVSGGSGTIITHNGLSPLPMIGAPVEEAGRLKYINGCYDTLLVPPSVKGEPCLNILYFPKETNQSPHVHPSVRVGIVFRGSGVCHLDGKDLELKPGNVFIIPEDTIHSFETMAEGMSVVAFHPDSDCGPEHENHPMINRTIIEGLSASKLDEHRTR